MTTRAETVRRAERHELTFEGRRRRFLLLRPDSGPVDRPVPLVVDLHPSGLGPAAQLRGSGLGELAARGYAVAAPQGALSYQGGWAWSLPGVPLAGEERIRDEAAGVDDVVFLAALLDTLDGMLPLDPARRHLSGFSGGARLASHAAVAFGDRLASVACVGGVRRPGGPGDTAPPLLAVHGLRDDTNPYRGAAGPRWDEPVPEAVARWAGAAGCAAEPVRTEPAPGVTEFRHRDAAGREPVRLVAVASLGHAWPGTPDPLLGGHVSGTGSDAYDASAAVRGFFDEFGGERAGGEPPAP
ncbi:alpha/beta hydrolase family esterase [Streptomyces sp. NPDC004134]|uniref:alpha/beta hydrolase family esterase n=1 Tax=Streptomyces sp. NPDC004134 TaxID=3364691 RepID=UPI00368CD033